MFIRKTYTEQEIVEGCIQNDRKFQEMLYKKHFQTMIGMCMRHTSDRETAMEIVNIGFLKVFKKLDTFTFSGSLEGWIRRVVYHCLSDYYRKNSRYLQFLVFEDRDVQVLDEPLSNMYAEDIMKMVDLLPPATQNVFRLFAIEGLSHAEIGEQENISVGTSKWHLNAAREKLKALLKKNNNYRSYAG
jgi:RNA polymerase sigma factor, sigma-70 family